jgi:hypothetical protein
MRRRQKRQQSHQSRQFDLFTAAGGVCPPRKPAWEALPPQTRAALTDLMTRLILDHARNSRYPDLGEVHGDV